MISTHREISFSMLLRSLLNVAAVAAFAVKFGDVPRPVSFLRRQRATTHRLVVSPGFRHAIDRNGEAGADVMFDDIVARCKALLSNTPTSPGTAFQFSDVPGLLRAVFEADFERYLTQSRRDAQVQNLTCVSPIGTASTDVPMRTGRTCLEGACSCTCSRVLASNVASHAECEELCGVVSALLVGAPPGANVRVADFAASGDMRATLLIIRIVERLRRAIAHEYGVELASIAPHSAFVSQWVFRGHSNSHTPLHCDEAICSDFQYSAVLHLATQGDTFEGGDLVFSDPSADAAQVERQVALPERDGDEGARVMADDGMEGRQRTRIDTRIAPQCGRALIFSSGWENLHFVDVIESGVRHALPAFFMTRAAWATDGQDDMRGPVESQDVAAALLQYVLCPESNEDQGQFTMLWHSMFAAPLAGVQSGEGR